jgi:ribosome-binding factor A
MLAGNRSQRVGDLILREVSDLLLRKVKDPRVREVTLTEVKVSRDLRNAYIYYSTFRHDEQKEQVQAGFESSKGFIRKEIGARLRLRYIPTIQFIHDISLEYGERMERLLEKTREST